MPVSPPAAGPQARKLARFLGRPPGLLSGCLPTDTRPQARAKLGNFANRAFRATAQAFCTEPAATRRAPRALGRASIDRGEGFDAACSAHELHHHDDAA